jgi:hypothetical protein
MRERGIADAALIQKAINNTSFVNGWLCASCRQKRMQVRHHPAWACDAVRRAGALRERARPALPPLLECVIHRRQWSPHASAGAAQSPATVHPMALVLCAAHRCRTLAWWTLIAGSAVSFLEPHGSWRLIKGWGKKKKERFKRQHGAPCDCAGAGHEESEVHAWIARRVLVTPGLHFPHRVRAWLRLL